MYIEPIFLTSIISSFLISLLFKDTKLKVATVNLLMFFAFLSLGILSFFCIKYGKTQIFTITGLHLFQIGLIESYFFLLLSIIGLGITIHSQYYLDEYLKHGKNLKFYLTLTIVFLVSFLGVISANEVFTFLVFWEIMSFSSFLLVVGDYKKEGVLKSGAYYLIITHIGMFFILLSFIPFIGSTGSFFFSSWIGTGASLSDFLKNFVFICALIGFGSKAGLVPIHIWLPKAHPIAPSNVSAFMSAFMIKIPVLLLFKLFFIYFGKSLPLSWGVIMLTIAIASGFFGIFYGLIQSNFKKLLAFSSIENIGIIFTGFAIAMIGISTKNNFLINIGLFACIYHLINHAIFKSFLFLGAGSLIERTGTGDYSQLGGLAKKLPGLSHWMLLASIAISAIPPLNGFISEFLTFLGLFEGTKTLSQNMSLLFLVGIIFLALTSVFAFIAFVNFYGTTFLGVEREKIEVNTKVNFFECLSFAYFSFFVVLLSIFPGVILSHTNKLLLDYKILQNETLQVISPYEIGLGQFLTYNNLIILAGVSALFLVIYILYLLLFRNIRYVESWGCGYFRPIAQTEYTSFSFAQPIRKVFSYLFLEGRDLRRRQKDGLYSRRFLDFQYEVKDLYLFDSYIYNSIINFFDKLNLYVKKLQNGNLQSYLFYIFVAILCLIFSLFYLV